VIWGRGCTPLPICGAARRRPASPTSSCWVHAPSDLWRCTPSRLLDDSFNRVHAPSDLWRCTPWRKRLTSAVWVHAPSDLRRCTPAAHSRRCIPRVHAPSDLRRCTPKEDDIEKMIRVHAPSDLRRCTPFCRLEVRFFGCTPLPICGAARLRRGRPGII